MRRLENKRVVVTGGTRGIGRSIVEKFAEEGAHIAFLGRNEKQGQELTAHLNREKKGEQEFRFFSVDVSKKEEVDNFSKEILELWKNVDILINCAGITCDKLLLRMEEEDWDKVIATNLKSVYNMCHAFIRSMIKNRLGKIVNITSVIGFMGNPGQTNYAASKAGIIGFTQSLAKELALRNIQVNCIAPGFIETDMTEKLSEEQKKAILQKVPMGRLGQGKEIAQATLFLASPESDYITGHVLTVDGGMTT